MRRAVPQPAGDGRRGRREPAELGFALPLGNVRRSTEGVEDRVAAGPYHRGIFHTGDDGHPRQDRAGRRADRGRR